MEPKRRSLTVTDKSYLTPNMIRIRVEGDALDGFNSPSPDDNIKMVIPDQSGELCMRSYTPRYYDAEQKALVIDFAVHEAGPATHWALSVQTGDEAIIAGPRGSKVVTGEIDNWLLIGDETALPAMLRRVEEAGATDRYTMLASIPGNADQQTISTPAIYTPHWLPRNGRDPADASVFLERLADMDIPERTFIWLAAEGSVTRQVRTYLNQERGVPLRWIKATGYWVKGKADTTAKFEE